ncbi:MAG TPA: hypothetical protein VGK50_04805 [Coriobacteriia bacterium]|jgi:hypothetical protein
MSNQKMIIALLGVVAVLLAVIVGVLVFKSPSSSVPAVDTTALQQLPSTTGTGTTGAPTGMPGATPSGPFDPAKATKVSGDPKTHVDKYFSAIVKGDYATAFKLLPVDKQAQGEEAFASQIKGYGMSKYELGKADIGTDKATVQATVQTSGGPFTYIWSFVKYKGAWVVESRKIGGMGQ